MLLQIKEMPQEFKEAQEVLEKIEEAGYEAYFVGGCVRDTLLNKPLHDIDIATSAYPAEIKEIFSKTVDTGIQHGTVMVLHHGKGYEITTFRTETGYQDFRRPDKVTFVRSLKEDLKRRDFTINALALKTDGTVVDLFDGITDLNNNVLKAVGDPQERFFEDALRMMRAVRFASQLDFSIETSTLNAIAENSHLLEKIAIERILVEFEKMMLGVNPSKGLNDFLNTNMYKYCPGFSDKKDNLEQMTHHQLNHLENDIQLWTIIAICIQLNTNEIGKFLRSWKTSNDLIKNVEHTYALLTQDDLTQPDLNLLFMAGHNNVENALNVANILKIDTSDWLFEYENLQIKSNDELKISGKELIQSEIVKPGPEMGFVLNKIKQMVIQNEVSNDFNSLKELAKNILKDEK